MTRWYQSQSDFSLFFSCSVTNEDISHDESCRYLPLWPFRFWKNRARSEAGQCLCGEGFTWNLWMAARHFPCDINASGAYGVSLDPLGQCQTLWDAQLESAVSLTWSHFRRVQEIRFSGRGTPLVFCVEMSASKQKLLEVYMCLWKVSCVALGDVFDQYSCDYTLWIVNHRESLDTERHQLRYPKLEGAWRSLTTYNHEFSRGYLELEPKTTRSLIAFFFLSSSWIEERLQG